MHTNRPRAIDRPAGYRLHARPIFGRLASNEFDGLDLLDRYGRVTADQIARRNNATIDSAQHRFARLVNVGLVTRILEDPDVITTTDQRWIYAMTADGHTMFAEALRDIDSRIENVVAA